jgi:hypothetical protein
MVFTDCGPSPGSRERCSSVQLTSGPNSSSSRSARKAGSGVHPITFRRNRSQACYRPCCRYAQVGDAASSGSLQIWRFAQRRQDGITCVPWRPPGATTSTSPPSLRYFFFW